MYVFKPINSSDIFHQEIELHKTFNLNTGSDGINSIQYISGSSVNSGSYWESLRVNFYLSGSDHDNPSTSSYGQYGIPYHSLEETYNYTNPRHKNKFMMSGSIISIAQRYFGDYIVPKSFKLVDNSTSTEVTIKDDGYGNLYPVGNSISQSTNSPSSSDNYVGNIFYKVGLVTLTTTGSYASGVKYTDVTTGNYNITFDSSHKIYTREYNLTVDPTEFNYTMNPTARQFISKSSGRYGQHPGTSILSSSPLPKNEFTSSKWAPLMTTIGLYNENKELVMVAKYSKPIAMSKDFPMTFRIKMDW